MPWRERLPMDERVQFISDYQRQLISVTELCDRYGVSRKTGTNGSRCYEVDAMAGLAVRSSRPHAQSAVDRGPDCHGNRGAAETLSDSGAARRSWPCWASASPRGRCRL